MKKIKQLLLVALCLSFMLSTTSLVADESTEHLPMPLEHYYKESTTI